MSDERIPTIAERRIVPDEPTTLTVHVVNGSVVTKATVHLVEIRDGLAFTSGDLDGRAYDFVYCLVDGARDCYPAGGESLTPESLVLCQELAVRKTP